MLMTVLRGDLATKQINARVKHSDISPILLSFETHIDNGEYLLREGHPAKADETYMDIYGKADKSVYIVDNYIDIKTLRLLQTVKNGVTVKIFSDNVGNHLHIPRNYHKFVAKSFLICLTFKFHAYEEISFTFDGCIGIAGDGPDDRNQGRDDEVTGPRQDGSFCSGKGI